MGVNESLGRGSDIACLLGSHGGLPQWLHKTAPYHQLQSNLISGREAVNHSALNAQISQQECTLK